MRSLVLSLTIILTNVVGTVDSFRKITTSNALMIDSLLPAHVLGGMDASLGEIYGVANMHIGLDVKLSFYRVQWILLMLVHEVQRSSSILSAGWDFPLHGRRF